MIRTFLKILRKLFTFIKGNKTGIVPEYTGQDASDIIYHAILSERPLMVARFGAVELRAMIVCKNSDTGISKYMDYITHKIPDYKMHDNILKSANINAGIFPPTKEILFKFTDLMLNDVKDLDILGIWLGYEKEVLESNKNLKSVRLKDIEPYYHNEPWTKALENKIVLVIHPFTDSITKQYNERNLLFRNEKILHNFTLKTIKSVQSAAGQKNLQYEDWFAALEGMKNEIEQTDFDIAILGCGAYGFPLAAHIKRMGKQAIHLGGATQILFGIKGKRWENHKIISKLFNEHWIRPNDLETPKSSSSVEDGCYW